MNKRVLGTKPTQTPPIELQTPLRHNIQKARTVRVTREILLQSEKQQLNIVTREAVRLQRYVSATTRRSDTISQTFEKKQRAGIPRDSENLEGSDNLRQLSSLGRIFTSPFLSMVQKTAQ